MKAFVIRLKGIDSSESLAQECILSGHQNNLHIEPFDGIFGEEDIKNVTTTYGIRPFREGMKKNRLGVKGCFLSHYTLWLRCIELNENNYNRRTNQDRIWQKSHPPTSP